MPTVKSGFDIGYPRTKYATLIVINRDTVFFTKLSVSRNKVQTRIIIHIHAYSLRTGVTLELRDVECGVLEVVV